MIQGFDSIAKDYDRKFTFSEIGKLQREHVLSYVVDNLCGTNMLNILEINCGTGEDALFFERMGHRVVATDASNEMIKVAKSKISGSKPGTILFEQLSFNDINSIIIDDKFDLVFSNFGGLNCISSEKLENLFNEITKILKPNGRFVGIIMPKFCVWEIFYFFVTFKWKKIFRRSMKGPLSVTINGTNIKTWYYSPHKIKLISRGFKVIHFQPIGIALPPTYLEDFFKKRKGVLNLLNKLENIVNKLPILAGFSDHFLFDLQLVNKT